MSVVPITSQDLDGAEISWFSALCSDDYQFLGVPDGTLRSSWDHCSSIVKEAEAQGFGNILCPSSYQVGQDTLSFVAGCAPITEKINMLAAVRAKAAGCPMAVALINDPTLVPLMGPLGIDAYINPRATTVSSILRHIRHGRVRAVYSIGDAEAEMIEAEVLSTSPLAGKLIRDIDFPEGVLVGGVLKDGKLHKPLGKLRIDEGDVIALFTMTADVPEVERLLQVSIDFF